MPCCTGALCGALRDQGAHGHLPAPARPSWQPWTSVGPSRGWGGGAATAMGNRLWLATPANSLEQPVSQPGRTEVECPHAPGGIWGSSHVGWWRVALPGAVSGLLYGTKQPKCSSKVIDREWSRDCLIDHHAAYSSLSRLGHRTEQHMCSIVACYTTYISGFPGLFQYQDTDSRWMFWTE